MFRNPVESRRDLSISNGFCWNRSEDDSGRFRQIEKVADSPISLTSPSLDRVLMHGSPDSCTDRNLLPISCSSYCDLIKISCHNRYTSLCYQIVTPRLHNHLNRKLGPAVHRRKRYPARRNADVKANMNPMFSAMVNDPALYVRTISSPVL